MRLRFTNILEISGRKDYGCYFGYENKRYWFRLSAALNNFDDYRDAFDSEQK